MPDIVVPSIVLLLGVVEMINSRDTFDKDIFISSLHAFCAGILFSIFSTIVMK